VIFTDQLTRVQIIVELTTKFFALFASPETYGPKYFNNLTRWEKRDTVVSHENSINFVDKNNYWKEVSGCILIWNELFCNFTRLTGLHVHVMLIQIYYYTKRTCY